MAPHVCFSHAGCQLNGADGEARKSSSGQNGELVSTSLDPLSSQYRITVSTPRVAAIRSAGKRVQHAKDPSQPSLMGNPAKGRRKRASRLLCAQHRVVQFRDTSKVTGASS
mgnify:CR=1 FL=1